MKKTKPKDGRLTLKLDGNRVTADRFVKGISAFVSLINEVSDNVSGDNASFRWVVSVEKGSNLIHFRPEARNADASFIPTSVDAIVSGFSTLEQRAERPMHWSDVALRRAKELSDIYDATTGTISYIGVLNGGRRAAAVTRHTAASVEQLIGADLSSLGTVEGRLRTVTEGGGLHFVVQDAVTHNNVRCYFDDEDTERYMAAFRKRVAVYGEVRYRRDGTPVSIRIEPGGFRVLREKNELPTVADMRGILVG